MTQDIPTGRTKEDIKTREQLIKYFYARWIADHPDKRVLNVALGRYINVKFLSINETYELLVMRYENIKLTIGLQRSNQDLVQYCITVPQQF